MRYVVTLPVANDLPAHTTIEVKMDGADPLDALMRATWHAESTSWEVDKSRSASVRCIG